MITLRPAQEKAVNETREALSRVNSVLLRAPCRFGKTVVASYIAQRTTLSNRRAIFSCHRDAILNQVSKTFDKFDIDHGFIVGGVKPDPFRLAQVASADTLCNRLDVFDGVAGILIVDECHLWHTKTRKLIIDTARASGWRVIGLSATPMRPDGRALSDLFDEMVYGPSEFELIMAGDLARYQAFGAEDADLTGLGGGEDYSMTKAAERLNKPRIVGNAVDTWKKRANGLRTVVYCINRKHGKDVHEAYLAGGVKSAYIDGKTPKNEQIKIANMLADREIDVLVSVELLTTGYDLGSLVGKDVTIECVQLLRPTKSLPLAIQMMMRCMTAWNGTSIILDHVNIIMMPDGVTTNHGFPDDDRDWNLDGKPRAKKAGEEEFNVWRCDECFADVRSTKTECPYCNKEHTPRERKIEMTAGELQEIKRHEEAVKKHKRQEVGMARTPADMARVAIQRGYKAGWVVQKAKQRGISGIDYRTACGLMMKAKQELSE